MKRAALWGISVFFLFSFKQAGASPATPGSATENLKTATENVKKESAIKEETVPWRGSVFIYENDFSALSLNRSADLTYNPYYEQSFSFRPRYHLRDDLYLAGRLDLGVELTESDETDYSREWIVSDLLVDVGYAPKFFKIPVVDIQVGTSLRLGFPTSIRSRNRSLMMSLAPGFSLKREFKLLKGNLLTSLKLTYGFRVSKYLYQSTIRRLANPSEICIARGPDDPSCIQTGTRNVSTRFSNAIEAELTILPKLTFMGSFILLNDILYTLPETEIPAAAGDEMLPESSINSRALTWTIFQLGYDVFDWLNLAVGTSTYNPQLTEDSSYYFPFFNRYTNFYFAASLPVDKFVSQVQTWTGWGKGKK